MATLSEISTLDVVALLQKKKISGADMPKDIRLNVVNVLRRTYTEAEIGHLLELSHRTITRITRILRDNEAELVKDLTIDKVAGESIAIARRLQTAAWKKGNLSLVWQIQRELIANLQSMGYIHTEPKEIKIDEKIEAGPALIKLLGQKDDNDKSFGERWRDIYRHANAN